MTTDIAAVPASPIDKQPLITDWSLVRTDAEAILDLAMSLSPAWGAHQNVTTTMALRAIDIATAHLDRQVAIALNAYAMGLDQAAMDLSPEAQENE